LDVFRLQATPTPLGVVSLGLWQGAALVEAASMIAVCSDCRQVEDCTPRGRDMVCFLCAALDFMPENNGINTKQTTQPTQNKQTNERT
jgi:hypothetical protein